MVNPRHIAPLGPARRRLLLGLAAAPAVIGVAHAAPVHQPGQLRPRREEAKRFADWINATSYATDEALEAEMDRLWAMETAVLRAPIRTVDDALAKLECCAIMAERGMRTDWLDCEAVGEVSAFLKGAFA